MFIAELLSEDRPKIRKVSKVRADDSTEVTYEVLDSAGVTVKTGLSKQTAQDYLKQHYFELVNEDQNSKHGH